MPLTATSGAASLQHVFSAQPPASPHLTGAVSINPNTSSLISAQSLQLNSSGSPAGQTATHAGQTAVPRAASGSGSPLQRPLSATPQPQPTLKTAVGPSPPSPLLTSQRPLSASPINTSALPFVDQRPSSPFASLQVQASPPQSPSPSPSPPPNPRPTSASSIQRPTSASAASINAKESPPFSTATAISLAPTLSTSNSTSPQSTARGVQGAGALKNLKSAVQSSTHSTTSSNTSSTVTSAGSSIATSQSSSVLKSHSPYLSHVNSMSRSTLRSHSQSAASKKGPHPSIESSSASTQSHHDSRSKDLSHHYNFHQDQQLERLEQQQQLNHDHHVLLSSTYSHPTINSHTSPQQVISKTSTSSSNGPRLVVDAADASDAIIHQISSSPSSGGLFSPPSHMDAANYGLMSSDKSKNPGGFSSGTSRGAVDQVPSPSSVLEGSKGHHSSHESTKPLGSNLSQAAQPAIRASNDRSHQASSPPPHIHPQGHLSSAHPHSSSSTASLVPSYSTSPLATANTTLGLKGSQPNHHAAQPRSSNKGVAPGGHHVALGGWMMEPEAAGSNSAAISSQTLKSDNPAPLSSIKSQLIDHHLIPSADLSFRNFLSSESEPDQPFYQSLAMNRQGAGYGSLFVSEHEKMMAEEESEILKKDIRAVRAEVDKRLARKGRISISGSINSLIDSAVNKKLPLLELLWSEISSLLPLMKDEPAPAPEVEVLRRQAAPEVDVVRRQAAPEVEVVRRQAAPEVEVVRRQVAPEVEVVRRQAFVSESGHAFRGGAGGGAGAAFGLRAASTALQAASKMSGAMRPMSAIEYSRGGQAQESQGNDPPQKWKSAIDTFWSGRAEEEREEEIAEEDEVQNGPGESSRSREVEELRKELAQNKTNYSWLLAELKATRAELAASKNDSGSGKLQKAYLVFIN